MVIKSTNGTRSALWAPGNREKGRLVAAVAAAANRTSDLPFHMEMLQEQPGLKPASGLD